MRIVEYFACGDRERAHWRSQIGGCDWSAGKYLAELLAEDRLRALCGERTRVLLLAEGERLVSFCTLAEQDEIREPSMTPWVGFAYTFPEFRGGRRLGRLLEHARALAEEEGASHMYVSTDEEGLYEKYGFVFLGTMRSVYGSESRVYRRAVNALPGAADPGRERT